MKLKRAIGIAVALLALTAHAVTITGVVKTSGGSGLEGVKVKLGKANIVTTTGSDGSFTLSDATGLKRQFDRSAYRDDCPFRCEGDRLIFTPREQAEVIVTAYDCNGRLLFSREKAAIGSNYSVTLPHSGSGIRIVRVSVNHKLYAFKNIAGIGVDHGAASTGEFGLAKRSKATARIDDALLFIKQGYQYSRVPVTKPDTSGVQVTMAPQDTGTLTDADGNVYKTVRIGNQYWMAENLRTTKYNDGSSIGSSACMFYNNTTDAAAKKKWGALYTDAAANSSKLAPTGWRVPTGADWDTLINYLVSHGYNFDGTTKEDKTAKSMAAATDWETSTDTGAIGNDLSLNNASGFSALPAGWKFWDGKYEKQKTGAYWWIGGGGAANVCDLWWIFRGLDRYSTIYFSASIRLVKRV
jgi:uncharacterized protein (TIGR02145 family)